MRNVFFAENGYKSGVKCLLLNSTISIYPGLRASRAASLNSAIGRGLRKSKGVGFRGKERNPSKSDGLVRRGTGLLPGDTRMAMTRDAWRRSHERSKGENKVRPGDSQSTGPRIRRGKLDVKSDVTSRLKRSRAARFNDSSFRLGKKSLERKTLLISPTEKKKGDGGSRRNSTENLRQRQMDTSDIKPNYRPAENWQQENTDASYDKPNSPFSRDRQGPSEFDGDWSRSGRVKEQSSRYSSRGRENNADQRAITRIREDRLPLSIPYTTPASEFLYGTSVVEAALRSDRNPRRKLYKIYIYSGENRENTERDGTIERLAKKNGVSVQYVGTEWVRTMDKMSGGRPHNGYILEASPLPRLPVTSLGAVKTQDGKAGFLVSLDHQSREEAAINGTSNFIPIFRDARGRNPFVLLLDSIVDPGNVGGIIRTASFLGVTAIAISTRNSASFTPVVLKASAGASENITLFSVSKPAGFIVDSKAAGWKVYAAVAPSGRREANPPSSLTTDELEEPLRESPCILMLGNEGDGLRWNLRSKADVEVGIPGVEVAGRVNSLNVSVATGILCDAFLRGRRPSPRPERNASDKQRAWREKPGKDLF